MNTRSVTGPIIAATLTAALVLVVPAVPAGAASTSANPTDRGWWTLDGFHIASNQNYGVSSVAHNYFVFDLAAVTVAGGTITEGTLSLVNPTGAGTARSFTLHDVSATPVTLDTDDGGSPAGIAIYEDLGAGTVFGAATPPTSTTSPIVVPFNPEGIAALNAARGQSISFGGMLMEAEAGDSMFYNTGATPGTDVVLSLTIALPTTLSIHAPAKAPEGSRARVSGVLASSPADPACSDVQTLALRAGRTIKTTTTAAGGAYSFRVRIVGRTPVRVAYGGTPDCAAANARKVIRST